MSEQQTSHAEGDGCQDRDVHVAMGAPARTEDAQGHAQQTDRLAPPQAASSTIADLPQECRARKHFSDQATDKTGRQGSGSPAHTAMPGSGRTHQGPTDRVFDLSGVTDPTSRLGKPRDPCPEGCFSMESNTEE